MIPRNIPSLFYKKASECTGRKAFRYRLRRSDPYRSVGWDKFRSMVTHLSCGLVELGVKKGDKVLILCDTRYEWAVTDYAVLTAGAIVVPIYPTLPDDPVKFIANNCGARIAIVENKGQLQKIRGQWKDLPNIEKVIVVDDFGDLPENDERITSFEKVLADGKFYFKKHRGIINDNVVELRSKDIATIIYTSGTTGDPKGVVLTHGNILNVLTILPDVLPIKPTDRFLSFLPLSHVFERVGGLHYAVSIGAQITFCSAVDRIGKALQESGATAMCVVPRLLEKIHAKVMLELDNLPPKKRKMVDWAFDIARKKLYMERDKNRDKNEYLKLQAKNVFAQKVILAKIKKTISPSLKIFISGGAPLSIEVAEFFSMIGIPVLQGYGLTETSAPATVNMLESNIIGTVGRPLPNIHIKFAEDGEILIKGPSVFSEYYNNPEATKDSFDGEWFKSGDIGELDENGYLRITDRKKDLIITSSGKNVAPQIIENAIKSSPSISNVIVIGEKRKYLSALITLNEESILGLIKEGKIKTESKTLEEFAEDKNIIKYIREIVDVKTAEFADYEHIKKFTILPSDFTVSTGEITPTLKVKRKFVREKYEDIIEAMY